MSSKCSKIEQVSGPTVEVYLFGRLRGLWLRLFWLLLLIYLNNGSKPS